MRLIELTDIGNNDIIHVNPDYIVAMFYDLDDWEGGGKGLVIFFQGGFNVTVKESTVEVLAKINGETNESK